MVNTRAVSVIAGDNVSLICTTDSIVTWTRGNVYSNSSTVFQAAVFGSKPMQEILIDGYMVDVSVDSQVVLIMKNASTVQADHYYCSCFSARSVAVTSVTVLGKWKLWNQV